MEQVLQQMQRYRLTSGKLTIYEDGIATGQEVFIRNRDNWSIPNGTYVLATKIDLITDLFKLVVQLVK